MKCRLCGQPPTEPDGLCGDCSRAIARARDGAVNRREPSASAVARIRRASRIALTTPIAVGDVPQRRLALWGGLVVVTLALAFVDTEDLLPASLQPVGVVKTSRRPAASQPRVPREVPLLSEPEALPNDDVADATRAAAVKGGPARESAPARGPTRGPKASGAPVAMGPGSSDNGAGSPNADESQAAEANLQLARAAIPQAAPAVDDRQVLASALERCNEEKFLAGVICEQKARLKYCDGKWGQDPQCTPKPRVD
jgi:hypothetical protein